MATTTADATCPVVIALERLDWSRGFTSSLLESLDDKHLMARAGGKGNHAIWIMGHIAQAEDEIRSQITGDPKLLNEEHHELFRGGSQPSENRDDYPSRAELLSRMEKVRKQTIDWVKTLSQESGAVPTPESLQPFAPNSMTTAFTITMHELIHTGQIAAIRSSLGMEPVHR